MSKVRSGVYKKTPELLGWRSTQPSQQREVFAIHDTTLPFRFDVPKELPFAFSLTALAEHLAPLVDQRKRRGVRYPLVPLLLTALLAKLAGSSQLEQLSHWAQLRATELTARFGLARPTMPHQSTWSRLFAHAIDLDAFEHLLTSFFLAQQHASELPERGSIVLALDGKTLRGTPSPQARAVASICLRPLFPSRASCSHRPSRSQGE